MSRSIRTTSVVLAIIVGMTFSFAVSADSSFAAAKKPGKPVITSAKTTTNSVTIKWRKIKGAKGYVVYRNGKAIKSLNALSYKNSGLKSETKYNYRVRAYTTTKQTRWYNKKTKKWQVKKPVKKYRGKKKKVIVRLYGANSNIKYVRTARKPSPVVEQPKGNDVHIESTTTPRQSGGESTKPNNTRPSTNTGSTTRPPVAVTDVDISSYFYGTTYPGEDAKKPTNYVKGGLQYQGVLEENGYYVLEASVYPKYGENNTKPVKWTVNKNTMGITTETKGRNLIIKTPKVTQREQTRGEFKVTLSVEGHSRSKEYDYLSLPSVQIEYNDLRKNYLPYDKKRAFLYQDYGGGYSDEIKATVDSLTKNCATDRQKIGRIITWFNQNITYDYNYRGDQSVVAIWRNKRGVCGHISKLLAQMFRYAGIPAGDYHLSSANHSCTVFWMDGEWYTTDGTGYEKNSTLWSPAEKYMAPLTMGFSCTGPGNSGFNIHGGVLNSALGRLPTNTAR